MGRRLSADFTPKGSHCDSPVDCFQSFLAFGSGLEAYQLIGNVATETVRTAVLGALGSGSAHDGALQVPLHSPHPPRAAHQGVLGARRVAQGWGAHGLGCLRRRGAMEQFAVLEGLQGVRAHGRRRRPWLSVRGRHAVPGFRRR